MKQIVITNYWICLFDAQHLIRLLFKVMPQWMLRWEGVERPLILFFTRKWRICNVQILNLKISEYTLFWCDVATYIIELNSKSIPRKTWTRTKFFSHRSKTIQYAILVLRILKFLSSLTLCALYLLYPPLSQRREKLYTSMDMTKSTIGVNWSLNLMLL